MVELANERVLQLVGGGQFCTIAIEICFDLSLCLTAVDACLQAAGPPRFMMIMVCGCPFATIA